MNTTAKHYDQACQPLTDLVDAVPADAWDQLSPCDGWTARDVVTHLIDTQREFLTGRGLEVGPAPAVATDPAGAWHQHTDRVTELLSDDDVVATSYDGHFGPTTIGDTLERFYAFDMVVHRWDIARAVGADAELTEEEMDRIETGAQSLGDALYMDGVCKPGVQAPDDAPRQARVLAMLGRTA